MDFVVHEGHFLSADHMRIAEIINDFDPTLFLVWIPPENREPEDIYPYAVVCRPDDGSEYLVLRIRENEMDHRVLARLWERDSKNGNVLDLLDAENAAIQAMEYKKQMEDFQEKSEMAAWAIRSNTRVKHDGVVYE